jgi:hypothetical protein
MLEFPDCVKHQLYKMYVQLRRLSANLRRGTRVASGPTTSRDELAAIFWSSRLSRLAQPRCFLRRLLVNSVDR